jgi:hypothetical protein
VAVDHPQRRGSRAAKASYPRSIHNILRIYHRILRSHLPESKPRGSHRRKGNDTRILFPRFKVKPFGPSGREDDFAVPTKIKVGGRFPPPDPE